MFAPTFQPLTTAYFGITAIALGVFTFTPRPVPSALRLVFMMLAIASVALSAHQISQDLPRHDWGGMLLRLLGCVVYCIMFLEGAAARRKQ
jgi:uncharacterized membrane protein HdeD (DUF308 family)